MTEQILGIVAVAAPLVQILLMGVIGYPIAKRRPGGMAAFSRSGFTWWIGVLALISVVALVLMPDTLSWTYPSEHAFSVGRWGFAIGVTLVFCLLVELVGERILIGPLHSERRQRASEKYEGALPTWARSGGAQYGVLSVIAVLEEFVFRAVALGGLWLAWELPKFLAAGLVAFAFGMAHWYYGFRQVTIKLIVGSAMVWCALSAGWAAAAIAHVLLNIVLTVITNRRHRMAAAAR